MNARSLAGSARSFGGFLALLVLAAAGCADEATQVIVLVDAEPGVAAQANGLRIRIQGRDGVDGDSKVDKLDEKLTGEIKWPVKLALAPAEDNVERVFWVEASALDGSRVLAAGRLISGYIEGETRYAKLLIEDACVDVSCAAEDQTCHAGSCVDAFRPPHSLAKSAKDAAGFVVVDGGPSEQDGAVDAGGDAATVDGGDHDGATGDAGADAGQDAATPAPECTVSSECPETKPICDPVAQSCRTCGLDGECEARSPERALCEPSLGQCIGCRGDLDCSGNAPVCGGADATCVPCTQNAQCGSGVCEPSGACAMDAAIVYWDPINGSNVAGCGSAAMPCLSLATTLARVSVSRPIVRLLPGSYGSLPMAFSSPLPVRVIADGVDLDMSGAPAGPAIDITAGADVTLEGLTLRNANGAGIRCQDSTLGLRRATISGSTSQGVTTGNCRFTIRESFLENNDDYGVTVSGGSGTIERTMIYANAGGGLRIFTAVTPLRVLNNLFVGNSNAGNYAGAIRGSSVGTDTVIAFNTFTGNFVNNAFIGILGCASDYVVDSNIVWGNTVGSVDSGGVEPSQTFINCTVSNTITEAAAAVPDNGNAFSNTITSDPLFVDAALRDFRLQAGSPAIDVGTASHAGELDYAGRPRILGDAPDLGCHER